MALETEESHVGLVELEELEAIEIDEALLRELLEEEQEADLEESVQTKNDNKTKDKKQQDHQNQQHEGYNIDHHFEWMSNNNDNNNNNMVMNWYPDDDDDDMVGMMVDFGYTNNNAQFGSQVSEGLICFEASTYGCLWHDL